MEPLRRGQNDLAPEVAKHQRAVLDGVNDADQFYLEGGAGRLSAQAGKQVFSRSESLQVGLGVWHAPSGAEKVVRQTEALRRSQTLAAEPSSDLELHCLAGQRVGAADHRRIRIAPNDQQTDGKKCQEQRTDGEDNVTGNA